VNFRWLDELARRPGNGTKVTEPISEMGPSTHQFPNRHALNVCSMRCASPSRVNADRRWLPCWTAEPSVQQATCGEPGRQDMRGRPNVVWVARRRCAVVQEPDGPRHCCQLRTWRFKAAERPFGVRGEGGSIKGRASHAVFFGGLRPPGGTSSCAHRRRFPRNPLLADPTTAPGGTCSPTRASDRYPNVARCRPAPRKEKKSEKTHLTQAPS
jgi:hypothetical protein